MMMKKVRLLAAPFLSLLLVTVACSDDINVNPVVADLTFSTNEDEALLLTLFAVDPDQDTLTYTLATFPENGTLTGDEPGLLYTPDPEFAGTDTFTFLVDDGHGHELEGTVTIEVIEVNDEPVAENVEASTAEDTPTQIGLRGRDVETSDLVYTIERSPAHGTVTGDGPEVTYSPDPDFAGIDRFTYSASDGEAFSPPATVTVTVIRSDEVPVADDQSVETDEDRAVEIVLTASDENPDQIQLIVTEPPLHGRLEGTPPTLFYQPDADYNGEDGFLFVANDGRVTSAPAEVHITVLPVNDAPEAAPQEVQIGEDTSIAITLTGSDVESDDLTFTIAGGLVNGELVGDAPDVTYVPTANFVGSDSFSFTVSDGALESEPQLVTIEVSQVNDAPQFTSDPELVASQGAAYQYVVRATDVDDGDSLIIAGDPVPGWLALEVSEVPGLARLVGTPGNADAGNHAVTLTVTDETGASDSQSFTVVVADVNDAPEFSSVPVVVATEDVEYVYDIVITDIDAGEDIAFVGTPDWLTLTKTGALTATLGGTPSNDDVGAWDIIIRAIDGGGLEITQEFTIAVANSNDAPTITSAPPGTVREGFDFEYTVTTEDVDVGDTITIRATTLPEWLELTDHGDGTASIAGSPGNDEVGSHDVVLLAEDGNGGSVDQSFSIEVSNTNQDPSFTSVVVTAATEDALYEYDISATDADFGAVLTISADHPDWLSFVDNGAGSARLEGTPSNDEVGPFAIELTVSDEHGAEDRQDFVIRVANTNDAPFWQAAGPFDCAAEDEDFSAEVSADDVDAGDSLTVAVVGELPSWVMFVDNGDATGTFSGRPANEDVGSAEVTVRVTDEAGASADAELTLCVDNRNDAPELTSLPELVTDEDATYTYSITTHDDDAGDSLTITATTRPDWLTFTDHGDGTATLTGTPSNDEVGNHDVTIEVSDDEAGDSQSFVVTVLNTNDAPAFTSDPLTEVDEDRRYRYDITTSDVDADDGRRITIGGLPGWALFFDNGDGTAFVEGVPSNDDVGEYDVTLTAIDRAGGEDVQAFSIEVINANDAPEYISVPVSRAVEDRPYAYDVVAIDVDVGDDFGIRLDSDLPEWLSWSDTGVGTATLSGDPVNADIGSYDIEIVAEDEHGATTVQAFTLEVVDSNDAPTFTSEGDPDATEDVAYSYELSADDVDPGDALHFTPPAGLPGWLRLENLGDNRAELYGTPTNADVGTHEITLWAVDRANDHDEQTFIITVVNTNDVPEFVSLPPLSVLEDTEYSYAIEVRDVDDLHTPAPLTIAVIERPEFIDGFTDNGNGTASLSGTPGNEDVGEHTVVLTVTDGIVTEPTRQEFTVTVINVNDAPEITSTALDSVLEDDEYLYEIIATDIDVGDRLRFEAPDGLPGWLGLADNDDGSAELRGTPENGDVGPHAIVIDVVDVAGETDRQSFTVTVTNTNDAPVFTSEGREQATEEVAYTYDITTDEIDVGDTVTIAVVSKPAWLTEFTDNGNGTATLSGTPGNGDVGTDGNDVELTVTDDSGEANNESRQEFTINVANVNDQPTFVSDAETAATQDQTYTYDIEAADVDAGDTLSITLTSAPLWLTDFTDNGNGTATLSGTPSNDDVGTAGNDVVLTVADDSGADNDSNTQEFTINVANVNDQPTFVSDAQTSATQDVVYSYDIGTADVDVGDTLTIGATQRPAWLTDFTDNGNGTATLSGTPTNDDVGTDGNGVVLTVMDDSGEGNASNTQEFTIDVANVNDRPTFESEAEVTATEDAVYSYDIEVADADTGDLLTIEATERPAWLTDFTDYGNGTATLSGTPSNDDVGTVGNGVVLTVTDDSGEANASNTQEFTIDVANVNDAPRVTSTPDRTARPGTLWEYSIATEDDDGDTLTITVPVKPTWLTDFTDNGNGTATLSGTPGVGDIGGTGNDVEIVVTDDSGEANNTGGQEFQIAVLATKPDFTSDPPETIDQDATYTYDITTRQGPEDPRVITFDQKPDWLTLNDAGDGTATLTGAPGNDDVGTDGNDVVLRVTDDSGEFSTQSFTVTVVNVPDAPTAGDDSYDGVIGNTTFTSTGLLDNDDDVDAGDAPVVVVEPITSTEGGTVQVSVGGDFTYFPPVGFRGPTDKFTYTVVDGGGLEDTGTVTLNFDGLIWYVDNLVFASRDGTQRFPFADLTDISDLQVGDMIYLFQGTSRAGSAYTGVTLADEVAVQGFGAPGPLVGSTMTLGSNVSIDTMEVTDSAGFAMVIASGGSATLDNVVLGGMRGLQGVALGGDVIINNGQISVTGAALQLASTAGSNVTLNGVDVTTGDPAELAVDLLGLGTVSLTSVDVTGAGAALAVDGVTTLSGTIGELRAGGVGGCDASQGITPVAVGHNAVDIRDTGTDLTIDELCVGVSGHEGVHLDTLTGTITLAENLDPGHQIVTETRVALSVNSAHLSGAFDAVTSSTTNDYGILLTDHTGTLGLGAISVSTSSAGRGVRIVDSGSVTVTSGTINSFHAGLFVSNTLVDLTIDFMFVFSGVEVGVDLSDLLPGSNVAIGGGTQSTIQFGTIGVSLWNVVDVSLTNVLITPEGSTTDSTSASCTSDVGNNRGCYGAIHGVEVIGLTLNSVATESGQYGLNLNGIEDLVVLNSTFANAGDDQWEGGIRVADMTDGAATYDTSCSPSTDIFALHNCISGVLVDGSSGYGLVLEQTGANNGSLIGGSNTLRDSTDEGGLLIVGEGSSSLGMTLTDLDLSGNAGTGIVVRGGGSADLDIELLPDSVSGDGFLQVTAADKATTAVDVTCGGAARPITAYGQGVALGTSSNSAVQASLDVLLTRCHVDVPAPVGLAFSAFNGSVDGLATARVEVADSSFTVGHDNDSAMAFTVADEAVGHLTVSNTDLAVPSTSLWEPLYLESFDLGALCFDMADSSLSAPPGFNDLYAGQEVGSTFSVALYVSDLLADLLARNNTLNQVDDTGVTITSVASCSAPQVN